MVHNDQQQDRENLVQAGGLEQKSRPALTKAERKLLRRQEKLARREQATQARWRKRLLVGAFLGVAAVAAVGFAGWKIILAPSRSEEDVISRSGIHWHADLTIIVNGERREVPAGIGIDGVHAAMHTHTVNDQIHMEMAGTVRRDDVRLGRFFEIWGERFSSTCILDACNAEGKAVKLFVNGEPNGEFENYRMRDGDRIEIRYE